MPGADDRHVRDAGCAAFSGLFATIWPARRMMPLSESASSLCLDERGERKTKPGRESDSAFTARGVAGPSVLNSSMNWSMSLNSR